MGRRGVVMLGVVALSLAACGSAASSSPTTTQPPATTTTVSAAASAYLTDVDPVNVAWHNFLLEASAWTSGTTGTQAEADAQPLISALRKLDATLVNVQVYDQWGTGGAHINTLMNAIAFFEGDLSGLAVSSPSVFPAASMLAMDQKDYAALSAAVNRVRIDLGLPPLPGSVTVS
jgi:hypothetical protein